MHLTSADNSVTPVANANITGLPTATDRRETPRPGRDRRATVRAKHEWQMARGEDEQPTLPKLGIGDSAGEWHDRFLIRSDDHMPHAVFITCGVTLRSDWDMDNVGTTLQDAIPGELQDRFTEGCARSLEQGIPVPLEGRFRDDDDAEVTFRCVMMPVKALNDDVTFIYGAYSQKLAA